MPITPGNENTRTPAEATRIATLILVYIRLQIRGRLSLDSNLGQPPDFANYSWFDADFLNFGARRVGGDSVLTAERAHPLSLCLCLCGPRDPALQTFFPDTYAPGPFLPTRKPAPVPA